MARNAPGPSSSGDARARVGGFFSAEEAPSTTFAAQEQRTKAASALARLLGAVAAPTAATPAQPESKPPTASPDPLLGRFGAWTAIKTDATGRRILCVCRCGAAHEVGRDALERGESVGCGCRLTPATPRTAPSRETYAAAKWRAP
jgi:hypothetical protein